MSFTIKEASCIFLENRNREKEKHGALHTNEKKMLSHWATRTTVGQSERKKKGCMY